MDTNFSEEKMRYLEMIQNIILRIANNSFMLKGWTITLISGIFVLAEKDTENLFFLLAYIPNLLFWFLDTYYLQLEKKFRLLYKKSIKIKNTQNIDFSLEIKEFKNDKEANYFKLFLSISELGFYFPLAIIIALLIALIK